MRFCCGMYVDRYRVTEWIVVVSQCLLSFATIIALPIILSQVNCGDLSSFSQIRLWGILQGFPALILFPTVRAIDRVSAKVFPTLYDESIYHYVPLSRRPVEAYKPPKVDANQIVHCPTQQLPICIAPTPAPNVPPADTTYHVWDITMPWQCPNSGRFASHRIEQIMNYYKAHTHSRAPLIIDDAQEFMNFDIPPSSRQFGPWCTRQVHGVFSSADCRAQDHRERVIDYTVYITIIVCVLAYLALLIYGTIVYSQNTGFCMLNQHVNRFALAMIILYWITPLWFPLFLIARECNMI